MLVRLGLSAFIHLTRRQKSEERRNCDNCLARSSPTATAGHVVAVEKSEIDDEVHNTIDKYLATYLAIVRFSNWGTNCRPIQKIPSF